VATLRSLWSREHPHRWPYLAVAVAFAVLVGFFFCLNDARGLNV
jgi:hypothetical protein